MTPADTAASPAPTPAPAAAGAPALLALDWGTSSLRAFLLDVAGAPLQQRSTARGISHLAQPGAAGFEAALAEIAGDWLLASPGLPVVAGGMVGSAQGWREAPYAPCPADVNQLAAGAIVVRSSHGPVWLAPGLICGGSAPAAVPDVMRGEEIQIAGALHGRPDWARRSDLLLPGTHAKWARVQDGAVTGFRTYMTGELFAVLRQHSLLGRLMPTETQAGATAPAQHRAAFELGLERARGAAPGDFGHHIFAARTLGLSKGLPAEALADHLSGLLIGHELVSGLAWLRQQGDAGTPLLLVGDEKLCARYASALQHFGQAVAAQTGNTAPLGLYHFALAAGLLPGAARPTA